MSGLPARPPGFARTVWLLLAVARRRAIGRRQRQRDLLRHRAGRQTTNWSALAALVSVAIALFLNVSGALLMRQAVTAGERVAAEANGWIVVDAWFDQTMRGLRLMGSIDGLAASELHKRMLGYVPREAAALGTAEGISERGIAFALREAIWADETQVFIERERVVRGLPALTRRGMPALLGSLALLLWSLVLVLQREGLDLDVQRRRDPMLEWLFSHPVPPAAVFLADMLVPLAASPLYWTAPIVPGLLYGELYGAEGGLVAACLIGVPLTLSAAGLGKALETGLMLRCAPRSRGAWIGIMGWLGSAAGVGLFAAAAVTERLASLLAAPLGGVAALPWPWLGVFLGQHADGSFSLVTGVLTCGALSAVILAAALCFSVWSARRGLVAPGGRLDTASRPGRRFGREPLYRKEWLWFSRDRSALVQVILLPLTAVAYDLFNMRSLIGGAGGAWNRLCGVGVMAGTYFIAVLGPKSLASEGQALWMALTWPRGLEALLRAKAWLWTLVSSAIVALVLSCAAVLFPDDILGIVLVGAGWLVFARSMALKAVTLATVTSPSGEAGKVSAGQSWAVHLGTLTFGIGLLSAQWPLVITGIVYATVTEAAMWQSFRARLPFLFDPWSETLLPAPSVTHAMIAISALLELSTVLIGVALLIVGRGNIAVAQTLAYGAAAACVSLGVAKFLTKRAVPFSAVWVWRDEVAPSPWERAPVARWRVLPWLAAGLGGGLALGLGARGYVMVLARLPWTAGMVEASKASSGSIPHLQTALLVMGVLIAPLAEEYLFRGLLYRALAREWRGWGAVLGSAAFFAMYHPPLAWLPVGALGMANALLFRRSKYLAPAVVLHMTYNAVVLA